MIQKIKSLVVGYLMKPSRSLIAYNIEDLFEMDLHQPCYIIGKADQKQSGFVASAIRLKVKMVLNDKNKIGRIKMSGICGICKRIKELLNGTRKRKRLELECMNIDELLFVINRMELRHLRDLVRGLSIISGVVSALDDSERDKLQFMYRFDIFAALVKIEMISSININRETDLLAYIVKSVVFKRSRRVKNFVPTARDHILAHELQETDPEESVESNVKYIYRNAINLNDLELAVDIREMMIKMIMVVR